MKAISDLFDTGRPMSGHATGVPRATVRSNLRPRIEPAPESNRNAEGRTTMCWCECGRRKDRGAEACDRCDRLDRPRARGTVVLDGVRVLGALARADGPLTMVELVGASRLPHAKVVGIASALRADGLAYAEEAPGRTCALEWEITDEGRAWFALLREAA
jgi:hypothetical protein